MILFSLTTDTGSDLPSLGKVLAISLVMVIEDHHSHKWQYKLLRTICCITVKDDWNPMFKLLLLLHNNWLLVCIRNPLERIPSLRSYYDQNIPVKCMPSQAAINLSYCFGTSRQLQPLAFHFQRQLKSIYMNLWFHSIVCNNRIIPLLDIRLRSHSMEITDKGRRRAYHTLLRITWILICANEPIPDEVVDRHNKITEIVLA